LSYLPEITSGETVGATMTSGEVEFRLRWGTLRETVGATVTSRLDLLYWYEFGHMGVIEARGSCYIVM
jgi:hypothetical protein